MTGPRHHPPPHSSSSSVSAPLDSSSPEIPAARTSASSGSSSAEDFRADVLKVRHHGSSSGTARATVETVRPGIAIASTGDEAGHTLELDTLQRLGGRPGPARRLRDARRRGHHLADRRSGVPRRRSLRRRLRDARSLRPDARRDDDGSRGCAAKRHQRSAVHLVAQPRRASPRHGTIRLVRAVALLVLIVALLSGCGGSANTLTVPYVVGLQETHAVQTVESSGLIPQVRHASTSEVTSGVVYRQSPREGTGANERTVVSIWVSSGPS